MRLIKLSTEAEFPEEQDLQKYFKEELPSRNPSGLFLLPSGWISKKGLRVGETLLFSYRNKLRYVAKAGSERLNNMYEQQDRYPYCFVIELDSLRETNIPLLEVEQIFQKEIGLKKSLSKSEGWVIIPDSEKAEQIIKELLS